MPGPESTAQGRSQPGTGQIIPKYQNPENDLAVKNGWRRDSPPAAFEDPQEPDDRPFFEDPNS